MRAFLLSAGRSYFLLLYNDHVGLQTLTFLPYVDECLARFVLAYEDVH